MGSPTLLREVYKKLAHARIHFIHFSTKQKFEFLTVKLYRPFFFCIILFNKRSLLLGEWKIDSTGYAKGFAIADGHVKFDNIDSFIIEINFDSDKVQHRKIHAEITTAPAVKTGKRIVLTVTSDGKNIVVGR